MTASFGARSPRPASDPTASWLNPVTAARPTAAAIAGRASDQDLHPMTPGGSLLSRMARLFGARAGSYYVAALVPGVAGVALMTALFAFTLQGSQPGASDPLSLWQSLSAGGKLLVIAGMIFGVWTPILLAARGTCRIAASLVADQPVSLATTLVDMAGFVPAAFVYSLLIGLPSMIGTYMLFLPGLFILSAFTLVIPAGVFESKGVFATLGRGVSLASKVYGKSLLLVFGSASLTILVVLLRFIGLDRLVSGNTTQVLAFRYALIYLPGLLVLILANLCFTLLYGEANGMEAPPRSMATHG
jgi:hypothetical protein